VKIQKIAILGGGTAGWLAANHLGLEFFQNPDIEITLIESPDIPSIGVGEGTVPTIRMTLESFGISETDFIRACDVTFKQGIKFAHWLDPKKHGEDNFYYHPFDSVSIYGEDTTPYWLNMSGEKTYCEFVGMQAGICDAMRAPKFHNTPEYQPVTSYAYHLNAAKFAKLLANNATTRFKVKHQFSTIVGAIKNDDGSIKSLRDNQGNEFAFDFFVDCSGFSSILLNKELSVPFIDKHHQLFTDSALTLQVPTGENDPIPPFTIATAHSAGWTWDIALTNRRGTGFVYSSAHMSDDQAIQEFARYLNMDAEKFSPRKIPMKIGYREKMWHKNCVAIGLAQGFVEPLEATSILVTDFAAQYLAKNFPRDTSDIDVLAQRYNPVLQYVWERVIDFIKLHYCISDRADSDFWHDNRAENSIPDALRSRLQLWAKFPPKMTDFFSKFEVFDVDTHLYVLYGMKFATEAPFIPAANLERHKMRLTALAERTKQFATKLPLHRDLLNHIIKYGLPKQ